MPFINIEHLSLKICSKGRGKKAAIYFALIFFFQSICVRVRVRVCVCTLCNFFLGLTSSHISASLPPIFLHPEIKKEIKDEKKKSHPHINT